MLSRVRGCFLAGACGDALGYGVEFSDDFMIRSKYGKDRITEMDRIGGVVEVSDDTQMDIYTAHGSIHAAEKNCDYEGMVKEIYHSYLRWYCGQRHKQLPSELGEDDLITDEESKRLQQSRAPGITCLTALASGRMGCPDCILNDSKGCGGVMRAAPAGVYYYKEPEKAYQLGCDLAFITHCHPLGYQSAGALAMIIAFILQGLAIDESVNRVIAFLHEKGCKEMADCLQNAVNVAAKGPEYANAFSSLGQGWVGEEAVAIAVWAALLYPKDLKSAVVKAVNHSGDSDSTGAVCGYIVGAALGEEAIPKEWLEHLELKSILVSQAEKLVSLVQ